MLLPFPSFLSRLEVVTISGFLVISFLFLLLFLFRL
jgi:hypothetical protein